MGEGSIVRHTTQMEPTMPVTDIAFLVLVAGSMIIFAATLAITSWCSG